MVLDGDVFDVPIRKDIVHRVVRWQLAKRQQVHTTISLVLLIDFSSQAPKSCDLYVGCNISYILKFRYLSSIFLMHVSIIACTCL